MELQLVPRNDPAKSITIRSFPFIIGSGPDCNYCLSEQGVSDLHACVVEKDGHFYVVDLNSKNGTNVIHSREGKAPLLTNALATERPDNITEQHLIPGSELIEGSIVAFAGSLFVCRGISSLPASAVGEAGELTVRSGLNVQVPNPCITITKGEDSGRTISLAGVPALLGRSRKKADIAFRGAKNVSAVHARISRTETGMFILEDLESRNGSSVNGNKVTVPVKLNTGDEISLAGDVEFIFNSQCAAGNSLSLNGFKSHVILTIIILTGICVVGTLLWLRGRGREGRAEPAVTLDSHSEIEGKNQADLVSQSTSDKDAIGEDVARIAEAEHLLASTNAWDFAELQRAQQSISMIPDTDSCLERKAICLARIKSRQASMLQADEGYKLVVQGDYLEAIALFDEALNIAPNNDGAARDRQGTRQLIQLKDALDASTNLLIDCQIASAQLSSLNRTYSGDTKVSRLFRSQVELIVAPAVNVLISETRALSGRGQYLRCLARIHDGLALLPENRELANQLAGIEVDARKVLTDMIARAYWLENENSAEGLKKASDIYAEIIQGTSLDDWTREFHLTASQRIRR